MTGKTKSWSKPWLLRLAINFPGCPAEAAEQIARHTAERGSGRVGRSAAGREVDPQAIKPAVIAHIRHEHTDYDEQLMQGVARDEARRQIHPAVAGEARRSGNRVLDEHVAPLFIVPPSHSCRENRSTTLTWKPLHGIVPPLVTPLLGRDEIDVEGTRRLLDHVIAGV